MESIPDSLLDRPVVGVNLMPGPLRDQLDSGPTLLRERSDETPVDRNWPTPYTRMRICGSSVSRQCGSSSQYLCRTHACVCARAHLPAWRHMRMQIAPTVAQMPVFNHPHRWTFK